MFNSGDVGAAYGGYRKNWVWFSPVIRVALHLLTLVNIFTTDKPHNKPYFYSEDRKQTRTGQGGPLAMFSMSACPPPAGALKRGVRRTSKFCFSL